MNRILTRSIAGAFALSATVLFIYCGGNRIQGNGSSQKKANSGFSTKKQAKDTFHLQSENLQVVIANNEAYGPVHTAGYSGVSEIYLRSEKETRPLMDRAGGLNFEYVFSGDSSSYGWNKFEPRKSPMEIERISSSTIRLRQSRTTNWPLASEITYSLNDDAIDLEYTGLPLSDIWKKHGYIGVFFATYLDSAQSRGINFIGRPLNAAGDQPQWIYHLSPEHGILAYQRSSIAGWDPSYDPGFPLTLVTGNSNYEYEYPFYYGLCGENVFIMMFDNAEKDGEIRFAQSPNSGNPGGISPAWDFMYLRKKYEVGKTFSFRMRMVYKKFEGPQDVIRAYEKWSGKKITPL